MKTFALVATLLAVLLAVNVASASAQGVPPDIEMQPPYNLQLTTDGGSRSFVAFASKVINKGPGVLKVVGKRDDTIDPTMDAKQILLDTPSVQSGKPARTVAAGQFQFSPSADHNHWHYLRFEDYNLLTVPDLQVAAPTRKTGFCLLGLNVSFWCAHQHPEYLEIGGPLDDQNAPNQDTEAMGMVVENSPDIWLGNRASEDEYTPTVEGQDIEITSVANGRYCLSFTVNPENMLVEDGYGNNGASKLIDIGGTPGGTRTVAEVAGGETRNSATCGLTAPVPDPDPGPDPGNGGTTQPGGGTTQPGGGSSGGGSTPTPVGLVAFSRSEIARLALTAIKRAVTKPRSVTRTCTVEKVSQATCRVTFKLAGAAYEGRTSISQRLRAAASFWFYAIDAKRTRVGTCKRSRDCPRRVKTKWLLGGAVGSNRVAAKRALRLRTGDSVRSNPGVAWPDSMLPPEGQAQVRAYKPAG